MINEVGQFAGGFTFYAPKKTKELMNFQKEFCDGIAEFGELAWDLYYPQNWTPHIALTGELDEEAAKRALSIIEDGFSATEVSIKKVVIKKDGEIVLEIYV